MVYLLFILLYIVYSTVLWCTYYRPRVVKMSKSSNWTDRYSAWDKFDVPPFFFPTFYLVTIIYRMIVTKRNVRLPRLPDLILEMGISSKRMIILLEPGSSRQSTNGHLKKTKCGKLLFENYGFGHPLVKEQEKALMQFHVGPIV